MAKNEFGEFAKQLFDCEWWDEIQIESFQFVNCILIKKFHQFKKGTKFDYAILDFTQSTLTFIIADTEYKFKLILDETTTKEIK